jgi:hypothetical protein
LKETANGQIQHWRAAPTSCNNSQKGPIIRTENASALILLFVSNASGTWRSACL